MPVIKIYCYVDESGQESLGRIFVVAVVVTRNRDEILELCEQIERDSGKGKRKWGESTHFERMCYLRNIFADDRFKGLLRFQTFRRTTNYDSATITAIAEAIKWKKPKDKYTTIIYVDGLTKSKRLEYGAKLRYLGIPVRKIQGIKKDESNTLTRLADAISGFVHDAIDGKSENIKFLFQKAKKANMLVDVTP